MPPSGRASLSCSTHARSRTVERATSDSLWARARGASCRRSASTCAACRASLATPRGADWARSQDRRPSPLLQEVAEGHPETALPGGVLAIGLRLRLLLVRQRLLARQANAPASLLDREDEDLHLAARREHAAMIGAARGAQLGVGHESRPARA